MNCHPFFGGILKQCSNGMGKQTEGFPLQSAWKIGWQYNDPFLMRSLWKRPLNENGHFLADRLAMFFFFLGGGGGGRGIVGGDFLAWQT